MTSENDMICDLMWQADISNGYIYKVRVALEKVEKYRWHDLRKDPDDLPKIMEQVLLKVQIGSDDYEYVTASRITGNDNGWTCFGYPVAWKEIDPFEVTK